MRDSIKVAGKITSTVYTLCSVGLEKLERLRKEYPEGRFSPEYVARRDAIYKVYASPKRRETPLTVAEFFRAFRAVKGNLRELFDVSRFQMSINHNIVTDEGDALIADLMSDTPARAKVNNANGHIHVGTGWTGTTPKANTGVNTPTGSPEPMDATYPKQKGAFGAAGDNVTQYQVTFEAGDLNASGINEAAILNNAVPASADCLAYGQLVPSANIGLSDTLRVEWEITYLGT